MLEAPNWHQIHNEFKSNMLPFQNIPIPINPFKSEDDVGYPPKIVM